MIKWTGKVQIKTSNTSLKDTKNIALSIQFSLDGFSFCISDFFTKTVLFFKEYLFEETKNTPEDLLKEIEIIFKSDENLQLDYKSVQVIHQNNLNTLVPSLFFNDDKLATYLNLNIKTLKNDFIAVDDFNNGNSKNIYIPFVNINNYLFQNFGEFEYKHHLSVLIDTLLKIENPEKTMYVNVCKHTFDVVVLEGKKLIFSNIFDYHTKKDFIYYILFVAEQLQLDTTKFKLYFTGFIDKNSDVYKITYKYIQHVLFLESKNAIFKNIQIPTHSNYILLGS